MKERLAGVTVCALGIAVVAAVASPRVAQAGADKLPSRTVQCGETVSESLRVANNLRDCAGSGLVVGAAGLTIDLGGHRIDGSSAAGSVGIDNAAGHAGVAIRNGIVAQFEDGVLLQDASGNTLSSLRVIDNVSGVRLASSSGNTLNAIVAAGNGIGFRVELASNDNAFTGNDASADGEGFYVEASSGNAFAGNVASGNGGVRLRALRRLRQHPEAQHGPRQRHRRHHSGLGVDGQRLEGEPGFRE